MNRSLMVILLVVILIILGVGAYMFFPTHKDTSEVSSPTLNTETTNENATSTSNQSEGSSVVIGKSVEGRDIVAYNFGTGNTRILLIGGVHGGYSWNTALLAYQLVDYFKANPNVIPSNNKITIIPVLNPDGLFKAVGTDDKFTPSDVTKTQSTLISSRFNANNVDLSRNFDCNWKASALWQSRKVSGGSEAFSEPESLAIKNYVESHSVAAAVVWYSSAGGVYASSCDGNVLPETTDITKIYAENAHYPSYPKFNSYETTGDLVNWMAKEKIPAISVLLSNHTDTELQKNIYGIAGILGHYSNVQ